jgi:hypothetical protein
MSMKKLPDKLTIEEKYAPAMEVKTKKEAEEYFEGCVEHNMRTSGHSREEAEEIERGNIGYYCGYYSREDAERVMDLFGTQHPIFGRTWPTPQEAFEMGREFAEQEGEGDD